jgi:hypothetical protein
MKRMIICTLISFLLAVSVAFTDEKPQMSYCEQANAAAQEEERRSILVNPDGTFRLLAKKGECTDAGMCVMHEFYGPCGMIKQFIDSNNDGVCDKVLEWKAFVDPKYGVFFQLYKVSSKCPLTV